MQSISREESKKIGLARTKRYHRQGGTHHKCKADKPGQMDTGGKKTDTHATITIGDPKKGPEEPGQSEKQESQYVTRARTENTDIS